IRLIPEILTRSLNRPLAVVIGDRLGRPQRVVGAERLGVPAGGQPGGFHRGWGGLCGADARQNYDAGHEHKRDVPASLHGTPFLLWCSSAEGLALASSTAPVAEGPCERRLLPLNRNEPGRLPATPPRVTSLLGRHARCCSLRVVSLRSSLLPLH